MPPISLFLIRFAVIYGCLAMASEGKDCLDKTTATSNYVVTTSNDAVEAGKDGCLNVDSNPSHELGFLTEEEMTRMTDDGKTSVRYECNGARIESISYKGHGCSGVVQRSMGIPFSSEQLREMMMAKCMTIIVRDQRKDLQRIVPIKGNIGDVVPDCSSASPNDDGSTSGVASLHLSTSWLFMVYSIAVAEIVLAGH
eukprot:gnl/MRDRNA2_/MRDRNA2_106010_c0_seq1.p1 gnl/MRDRNA2_/MRDRNA2_106010_c0~~gnl/MRDRNA2_/MRDRNA2_106010_c0_seq1.p1  ORF type:complete len:197 (-),score=28.70 gnl/MRDRNA2_/MRDRNA2_106010_c0_seq1:302-892(-)